MGTYQGYVWNYVHVGNDYTSEAPVDHCSNVGGKANTMISQVPVIAEKPYIVLENGKYTLMRPKVEFNKVGITKNWENSDEIDFDKVYVASDADSAATINAKLAEGLHLILQPGNYHLDDAIKVTNPNTVVMGLGLATLTAETGKPCIHVGSVVGVRI